MRKSLGMIRLVVLVAAVAGAMVVALPTGSAWARGDGWEPLGFTPYDAGCGDTLVHVTAPVNKEYFKQTTLPDGTIRWQVTGSLKLTYATDAGESVDVNASGPGNIYFLPTGDVEVIGKGLNSLTFTPEQAATLGVPQISVSAGPIDVTFHTDGTVSGHLGNIIEDVCAELT